METKGKITTGDIIAVYLILGILVAVGSFSDFNISSHLYNEQNAFGIFFCAYGERPMDWAEAAIGAMLIVGHNREKKGWGILQIMLGILFSTAAVASSIMMPLNYFGRSDINNVTIPVCIGALAVNAVIFLLVAKMLDGAKHEDVIRMVWTFFAVIILTTLVINLIKSPWERPRMRLISNQDDVVFQPWWHIGGTIKETLVAKGVSSDEFKSFPSGHTANAANILLFSLLPYLNHKLWKNQRLIFWMGILFAVLVAFSRIIMGAHFLTDVSFGFLISFTIYVIAGKLLEQKQKK